MKAYAFARFGWQRTDKMKLRMALGTRNNEKQLPIAETKIAFMLVSSVCDKSEIGRLDAQQRKYMSVYMDVGNEMFVNTRVTFRLEIVCSRNTVFRRVAQ